MMDTKIKPWQRYIIHLLVLSELPIVFFLVDAMRESLAIFTVVVGSKNDISPMIDSLIVIFALFYAISAMMSVGNLEQTWKSIRARSHSISAPVWLHNSHLFILCCGFLIGSSASALGVLTLDVTPILMVPLICYVLLGQCVVVYLQANHRLHSSIELLWNTARNSKQRSIFLGFKKNRYFWLAIFNTLCNTVYWMAFFFYVMSNLIPNAILAYASALCGGYLIFTLQGIHDLTQSQQVDNTEKIHGRAKKSFVIALIMLCVFLTRIMISMSFIFVLITGSEMNVQHIDPQMAKITGLLTMVLGVPSAWQYIIYIREQVAGRWDQITLSVNLTPSS